MYYESDGWADANTIRGDADTIGIDRIGGEWCMTIYYNDSDEVIQTVMITTSRWISRDYLHAVVRSVVCTLALLAIAVSYVVRVLLLKL